MFQKHALIPNGATEGAWFVVNGITHFVNGKSVIAESVRVIRSGNYRQTRAGLSNSLGWWLFCSS